MTLALDPEKFDGFRQALAAAGFTFEERPHQVFLARKQGVVVSLYTSGKIVITPPKSAAVPQVEALITRLGGVVVEKKAAEPVIALSGTRVGTDEVGKGDLFGPLVVAGAMVTEAQAEKLQASGVRDSKVLSDTTIANLAVSIRRILEASQMHVLEISPVRYNLLLEKEGNVNSILGWAHAQVLEQVLASRIPCKVAVADQFGDQSHIENALKSKGRDVELIQVPHAEAEISVAAASILAREASTKALKALGEQYSMKFPRGANANADEFAKELVAAYGEGALLATAKVHFGNIARIVPEPAQLRRSLSSLRKEQSTSSNPQATTRAYLELYSLISSFEQDMRALIQHKLEAVAGAGWWEERVPSGIRSTAEKLRDDERKVGHEVPLMECLGLHDYRRIIVHESNWKELFSAIFEADEKGVNAHFTNLYNVRNPVAHTRTMKQADIHVALGSIRWLRSHFGPG